MGKVRQSNTDITNGIPLPVPEAAEALGISPEAVRNRLSRGTLTSIRKGGKVFVLIDRDIVKHAEQHTVGTSELVDELRDRVADLQAEVEAWREESRRKDHIIAGLVERLPPQIEPPQEARESPESAEPRSDRGTPPEEPEKPTRPFWRRWFRG